MEEIFVSLSFCHSDLNKNKSLKENIHRIATLRDKLMGIDSGFPVPDLNYCASNGRFTFTKQDMRNYRQFL